MGASTIEIVCTACGSEALLRREPVYEGFRKTGETLRCAACGHVYATEAEVPFKAGSTVSVFSEADRPATVRIFHGGEGDRNCRHCAHYVVNPFTQRCGLHHREVQATDYCDDYG
jgi:hypothetical protein